ncbi:MAG TPA: hypothetical protein VLR90_04515 [Blastocatellia bacterium]|nr:hypothetical protein [Blastocatellia bacterium]
MTSSNLNNHSNDIKQRLIAVGGIHVFESQTPCKLVRAEPEGALKDLEWVDTLTLEARSEGDAEVMCGSEKISLKMAAPARLEINLPDDDNPADIHLNKPFKAQARLYDNQGRELEVGKFTNFEWTPSEILEVANDPSAGEFGFCDTCFGLHNFRAIKPGKGLIVARLGGLEGKLMIEAKSS